jgi:hypothetical protein
LAVATHPKGVTDHTDTVARDGSLLDTPGHPVEGLRKGRIIPIEAKKEPVPC